MTRFAAQMPTLSDIGRSQDSDRNLRRQEAKDHFYTVGNRFHFWGATVAIVLALASPFVLAYKPSLGPLLGAVAGVWIFATRLGFEPLKERYQAKGAAAQELFDCDVLGLPWNDALLAEPSDEEIRIASRGYRESEALRKHCGWYPTDVELAWPKSVLTCQRSNAVWGRQQHRAYGLLLKAVAVAWALFGIVFAMIHGASLTDYLTTIALPSLPAVLDSFEMSKKHVSASGQRQHLEGKTNTLWETETVAIEELREIQDQIYELRRSAPPVAAWFYRAVWKRYEDAMRDAAKTRAGAE